MSSFLKLSSTNKICMKVVVSGDTEDYAWIEVSKTDFIKQIFKSVRSSRFRSLLCTIGSSYTFIEKVTFADPI